MSDIGDQYPPWVLEHLPLGVDIAKYGPAGLGDPHPSYYRRKPDEINQWVENPDGIDTVAEEIADALRAEIEWLRDSNSKLAGHLKWFSNVHKYMSVERDRLLGEVTYLRSELAFYREKNNA